MHVLREVESDVLGDSFVGSSILVDLLPLWPVLSNICCLPECMGLVNSDCHDDGCGDETSDEGRRESLVENIGCEDVQL